MPIQTTYTNARSQFAKLWDEVIMRDPFTGIGKPEPLKFILSGAWSRRITQEHRIVCTVGDDRIDFLQCRYHY